MIANCNKIRMKTIHNTIRSLFLCGIAFWTLTSAFPGKPVHLNPNQTWTRISLGRQLFFDPILSSDSSVSCASCHKPEYGFADSLPFSKGVGGKFTKRNTPSVLNMANRDLLFWDGRANSLEHQALFPIRDPGEMNLPIPKAIARLKKNKTYFKAFKEVFGGLPSEKFLAEALGAYESSLETGNSPFDLYMNGKGTLDPAAKAGHALFVGKAGCFDCHFSPDFTGDEFKNIGLYNGKDWNDPGRYAITLEKGDLGKFKVPGLRNVARTAPYMHNGAFPTLRSVIDYYASPEAVVNQPIGTDSTIRKGLVLNETEKQQLEAFLRSLTSSIPAK